MSFIAAIFLTPCIIIDGWKGNLIFDH